MSIGSIFFLLFGFGILLVAFVMEGGVVTSLLQITAAIIVFGGTIAAVGLSFPTKKLKRFPKLIKIIFTNEYYDKEKLIEQFRELSFKVRKEGLLILENEISTGKYDESLTEGLKMVLDGIMPDTIKNVLESRLENLNERHKVGISIFEVAGGYSPTMGIIGTVMGLVQVLSNLSNPEELGEKIAVAFIATLYGVAFANLVWLPMAHKLAELNKDELNYRSMIIEGILLLQDGSNSTVITESLQGYLEK